jgi:hypothetical protein
LKPNLEIVGVNKLVTGVEENTEVEKPDRQGDFPSIEYALNLAKGYYEDSERRRNTIDSKLGSIITVNALVIGFASFDGSLTPLPLASVLLSLVSLMAGLWILRLNTYCRPGRETDEFYKYAGMDEEEFFDEVLLSHIAALDKNKEINDRRLLYLRFCLVMTALSVLSLTTSIITPLFV